jgi:hypothetical protein
VDPKQPSGGRSLSIIVVSRQKSITQKTIQSYVVLVVLDKERNAATENMKAGYLNFSSSLCLLLGHPPASGFHVALRHFPTLLFRRRVAHNKNSNITALLKSFLAFLSGNHETTYPQ